MMPGTVKTHHCDSCVIGCDACCPQAIIAEPQRNVSVFEKNFVIASSAPASNLRSLSPFGVLAIRGFGVAVRRGRSPTPQGERCWYWANALDQLDTLSAKPVGHGLKVSRHRFSGITRRATISVTDSAKNYGVLPAVSALLAPRTSSGRRREPGRCAQNMGPADSWVQVTVDPPDVLTE